MARILRTVLIALLLVMVGSSGAWAGHGQMGKEVPIKGALTGTHSPGPPTGCPDGTTFSFHSTGTGNVSHLGEVDYVLANCTTLVIPTVSIVGTVTFTAANGDVLVIAQEGSGPFDPNANPTSVTAYYTWTVDGGSSTGRFAGATGSGTSTFVSTVEADPEVTEAWLSGRIAYDASNRGNR